MNSYEKIYNELVERKMYRILDKLAYCPEDSEEAHWLAWNDTHKYNTLERVEHVGGSWLLTSAEAFQLNAVIEHHVPGWYDSSGAMYDAVLTLLRAWTRIQFRKQGR